MTPLAERLRANARLTILRFLEATPAYTLNTSTLVMALRDVGLAETRANVEEHVEFLAEARLVTAERPLPDVVVVRITTEGIEVAHGVREVAGVARPAPGRG